MSGSFGSFGGKIKVKTRKRVEGSLRMESYQDVWKDSIDIEYNGELTAEVCNAIKVAFEKSKFLGKPSSSYGALRWSNGDRVVGVDTVKRQLIIESAVGICD